MFVHRIIELMADMQACLTEGKHVLLLVPVSTPIEYHIEHSCFSGQELQHAWLLCLSRTKGEFELVAHDIHVLIPVFLHWIQIQDSIKSLLDRLTAIASEVCAFHYSNGYTCHLSCIIPAARPQGQEKVAYCADSAGHHSTLVLPRCIPPTNSSKHSITCISEHSIAYIIVQVNLSA